MSSPDERSAADPRERAKKVLLGVVQKPDFQREHRTMSGAVTQETLEDAIDAAYRTQFEDDRAGFRRKIAALGEFVVQELETGE